MAIVTGAARGIGLAYAEAFAAEGASVVIADIDGAMAEATAKAIGDGAFGIAVDIAEEASVQAMAEATVERFGGIDVLVNNAGLHLGPYNECIDLPVADWRRLLDVNVIGAVICARHCRAHLAARGGVILNQSSDSAYLGAGGYSISKLALNGVTLTLAAELGGDGIRVLGIAPGMVASDAVLAGLPESFQRGVLDRQVVKRFGRVEDLVGMALLLCSDDAAMISGETVIVDGGLVRRI